MKKDHVSCLFKDIRINKASSKSQANKNKLKCVLLFVVEHRVFLRRLRDPIRVPRISNRVPRIRENYHRVLKIRENYHRIHKIRERRVPRIREIGSLQMNTGYLTFSLKNRWSSTILAFTACRHLSHH